MFIAWKKTRLSSRKYEQDTWTPTADGGWELPCPHDKAADAVRLTPMVCESKRVDGKPRRIIVHRLGASIRPCCAAERAAPFVRAWFWQMVQESLDNAPAEVQRNRAAIEATIAARVPMPTDLEQEVCLHGRVWSGGTYESRYAREVSDWNNSLHACKRAQAGEEARRRAQEDARRWSGFGPTPPASISVLGLQWPTTREAIGKAYRRLASKHHPDRGGKHERMVQINRARDEALDYLDKQVSR